MCPQGSECVDKFYAGGTTARCLDGLSDALKEEHLAIKHLGQL